MKETAIKSPYKFPTSFTLDEDELPQLKDWKVGSTYKLEVTVKQVSLSHADDGYGDDKGKMTARFHIVSVKADDDNTKTETPRKKALNAVKDKADKY